MKSRYMIALPAAALLMSGSSAGASSQASLGYLLKLNVPVVCTVHHRAGLSPVGGGGYALGELQEYCNAPGGYQVTVNYAAGTLKGATVSVGDERAVLDGSGHSIVSRTAGPRIRDRTIVAVPGPAGFDTDRLSFDIDTI